MCFICCRKSDPRERGNEKRARALFADFYHERSARGPRLPVSTLPRVLLAVLLISCPWSKLIEKKLNLWSAQNRGYLDVYAVIDISVSLKTSSRIFLTKGQSILSAPVPRRGIVNLSTPCSWQCILNCSKQARIDEGVAWSHQFSLVICKISKKKSLLLIKGLKQPSGALLQFL